MRFGDDGIYQSYKTDTETLSLKKCKVNHNCKMCNAEIPKGSFCYGGSNGRYWKTKICLSCADDYFDNAIYSIKSFLDMVQKAKNDLNENKKEYQINNTLAKI